MNAVISPLVSEFETQAKEASYTAWLKEKIELARHSKKPLLAHDQVMTQARAVIELKKKKHVAG